VNEKLGSKELPRRLNSAEGNEAFAYEVLEHNPRYITIKATFD